MRLVVLLPEGVRDAVFDADGLRVGDKEPELQPEEEGDTACDPHAVLLKHPVEVALVLTEPQVEGVRVGVVEAQLVAVGVGATLSLTRLVAVDANETQDVTEGVTVQLAVGALVPLAPALPLSAAVFVAPPKPLAVTAALNVLLDEAQPESEGRGVAEPQREVEGVGKGELEADKEPGREADVLPV